MSNHKKLSNLNYRNQLAGTKPISEEQKRILKGASEAANVRIKHNNDIYESSAARAHLYPTK